MEKDGSAKILLQHSCHHEVNESVGPSYTKISDKNKDTDSALVRLVRKVIEGGSGVWREVAMPAHPALKEKDVIEIVKWIQKLE